MLRSDSLFGKKENNSTGTSPTGGSNSPFPSSNGFSSGAPGSGKMAGPAHGAGAAQGMGQTPGMPEGSRLIVGPNIKLKGVEITDCDTLVVEGRVEATMNSRVIQIAATGAFKGSAEIDIAEIFGEFDGTLTVRERLVIHSTGRVSGKIRYGKVVIEEGGQISGDVQNITGKLATQHTASTASSTTSSAAAAIADVG